ncbi:methylated-DNA--[protein]-cysteine S-methyltransferase [Gordonia soli]|uniref:Putative methylated-DNA--protein-cysteine methyltransferase n=1 Tax=Gordonia soli NBRC 108243 TaxID=1223545 RepID=M0QDW9_9ACTN|nr:methylated-DNA--[protein]-cysteine S-methyltransferase [Gordonia soli]GAC66516.1 putative methylated-DNA--protein-cysteine methyltransferase [Gordonia soli NBRC 108243]
MSVTDLVPPTEQPRGTTPQPPTERRGSRSAASPTTVARWSTVSTPSGPFTAVVDEDSVVLASGWTDDPDYLVALVHPTLRPGSLEQIASLGEITDAVIAYYDGDLTAIDDVAVRQQSGDFLVHAWDVLRTVPAGEPVSYTQFAERAGRPAAVRGAASACARNAAALFVPCHRVLRGDGGLGGFRYGLEVKRHLLAHESPQVDSPDRGFAD